MPKQLYTIDWVIKNFLPFFKQYNIDEHFLRSGFETWKGKRNIQSANDYLWSLFNQLLLEAAIQATDEKQFFKNQMDIYGQMLEFERRHEGKKGNSTLRQFLLNKLQYELSQGSTLTFKVTFISSHCCPYCASLDKKEISVQEALDDLPIANEKCTREWGCNCSAALVPQRDVFGKLILKPKF